MTSISYTESNTDHKQNNDHTNLHIIILTYNYIRIKKFLSSLLVGLLWAHYVPQSQIISATDDSRSAVGLL